MIFKSAIFAAALLGAAVPAMADGQLGAVRLTQSDGVVLNSIHSIGSVLVADPNIANVQPLSDDTLFLIGKSVGATRLFILDDNNKIVSERRIVVTTALSELSR